MCTGVGINRRKLSILKIPSGPTKITLLTLEAVVATLEGDLELRYFLLYHLRLEMARAIQANI